MKYGKIQFANKTKPRNTDIKHNTTILEQILSFIDKKVFEKIVEKTGADKWIKKFNTWNQLLVMILAQIFTAHGLRSIENVANDNRKILKKVGVVKNVSRSTISYVNSRRDPKVFEEVFRYLYSQLKSPAKKLFSKNLKLIDASEITFIKSSLFNWAEFRKTKDGVKIHVKFDLDKNAPEKIFMENGKKHENKTLSQMDLTENDIAVFDRGYNNYKQYGDFCKNNVQFVTRLKSNASFDVIEERKCNGKQIIFDKIIKFNGSSVSKKCSYELRIIKSIDEKTGKSITILTNILDENAKTIALMYKKRWNIEIFFKEIKQNLKIKSFYGTSKNAVWTQILIAMIVYLLYMLLKQNKSNFKNFTLFCNELPLILFQTKHLSRWFSKKKKQKPKKVSEVCVLNVSCGCLQIFG